MDLRKLLRDAERAKRKGRINVSAPKNVKVAKNIGKPGSTSVASVHQEVEINQRWADGDDDSRED
jgi:hypothetical protein